MSLLYTPYKIFHYPEKLQTLAKNAPISAPLHIRIKPTNVCNHACWYCAYRKKGMQLGQDMRVQDQIPRAKMLEICQDIVGMGVKAVTFSGGGEPFVYPHLLEAAQYLCAGGVKIASLTNGACLQGDIAEFFAHNATWVRVSMDGWDDASYMQYRRVKDGEYTKILKNIRAFKGFGGTCLVSANINIDAQNWSHLGTMLRTLKDIGVDNVKIAACITDNDAATVNAYHAPFFTSCKASIAEAHAALADATFAIYDSYHLLTERFEKDYSWCPYQQILMVIGADCRVYPCQDKAYNLTDGLLGSIEEQSFKQFWFADKSHFFAINPQQMCQHHCVANSKNKMLHEYLAVDQEHMEFV